MSLYRTLFGALVVAMLSMGSTAHALPNPSSTYCIDLGYEGLLVETDAGQVLFCLFPDGSSCEQWAFYSGTCGNEFSKCEQDGGILSVETSELCGGGECAICTFPDGRICWEQVYARTNICGPSTDGGPQDASLMDGAADDAAAGNDAATHDGSMGSDSGSDSGHDTSDDAGGCSCRLTTSSSPLATPLLLLMLALTLRRRKR